jgi:hypothetical protein
VVGAFARGCAWVGAAGLVRVPPEPRRGKPGKPQNSVNRLQAGTELLQSAGSAH